LVGHPAARLEPQGSKTIARDGGTVVGSGHTRTLGGAVTASGLSTPVVDRVDSLRDGGRRRR
jgi:hypothetical protein